MKSKIAILLVALLWGQSSAQSPDTGTIRGLVVRSGTSEPLSGVTITLTPQASADLTTAYHNAWAGRGPAPKENLHLANDGVTVLRGELVKFPGSPLSDPIVTDASGQFEIENVPAGSYAVTAEQEGYFGRGASVETPDIFDGAATGDMVYVSVSKEKPASAALALIPAGAISGRVTDSEGKPLVKQDVRAMRIHRDGNSTTVRGVTTTSTDDRGVYRLHTLPPGEYFIGSGLGFPESSGGAEDAAEESLAPPSTPKTEELLFTFHPSATDPRTAPAIVLAGGEDLGNKDIRVRRGPIVRIAGEVVNNSDAQNLSSVAVTLLQEGWTIDFAGVIGGRHALAGTGATATAPNRWKFEIDGAFPPGAHELEVVATTVGTRQWREARGSASVNVGSENIDGVIVVIGESR
jgi:hypothetical protein